MKLTVTVITRNEAANIEGALESVKWADEILVVDSHSTDETVAIAERHGDRVEIHDWAGYSAQRNFAAEIASHDWILALDADERVPPALAAEIQRIMRDGTRRAAATACRACPTTSGAGFAAPTGIPTISCGSTTAASAASTASGSTSRSS